jgi:hypothetical protein
VDVAAKLGPTLGPTGMGLVETGSEAGTIEVSRRRLSWPMHALLLREAKEEVVCRSEYQPMLAGFVAEQPDDEPAIEALGYRIGHDTWANSVAGRQSLADP